MATGAYSLLQKGATELKIVFLRISENPSFPTGICPKIQLVCLFMKTASCHMRQNQFTACRASSVYLCPLLVFLYLTL